MQQGLQIEKADLHKKNEELHRMYTEKTKKHQQTQHLYDTLKKRILMSQVQTAASDTVNRTVDSLTSTSHPNTFARPEMLHTHQRSGSASNHSGDALVMPPPDRPRGSHRPRKSIVSLRIAELTGAETFTGPTPQHRTQLPGLRNTSVRSRIPTRTSSHQVRGAYQSML